ncbi:MAG: FAD-binding oxidoreductase, partial [Thermomicrobiales bacterium]
MASATASLSWHDLSASLSGQLMMPGDPGFEDARHVWNGMIDLHPAAIAMCASVADVQHAVDFARNEGIDLSIRSGGHNAAGLSLVEGGLVIDLSRMKGVTVDPNARIARVQGGATWASVDQATTEHGLAT